MFARKHLPIETFYEVKTGEAGLTTNQELICPRIDDGTAILSDKLASDLNFPLGTTIAEAFPGGFGTEQEFDDAGRIIGIDVDGTLQRFGYSSGGLSYADMGSTQYRFDYQIHRHPWYQVKCEAIAGVMKLNQRG